MSSQRPKPGDSLENALEVDEHGHIIQTGGSTETALEVDERGIFVQRAAVLRIYQGPPSAIIVHMHGPDGEGRHEAALKARREELREASCHEKRKRQRMVRVLAPTPPPVVTTSALMMTSAAVTRVRMRVPAQQSIVHQAVRRCQVPALMEEGLYLTDEQPPEVEAILPHHQCLICFCVKSHPVSYRCGYSDCYVCIRVWLEQKWQCPVCWETMYEEPVRHYGEEAGLEFSYPNWMDKSSVDYSWDGLKFAMPPRHRVARPRVPDSP
ncbi:hypothetical protein DFH09DRAFT_1307551 [Mycena vulgaris]|nr:hypothetical protein DFH09DRAFT_1307551 [Mycena vulgaris]